MNYDRLLQLGGIDREVPPIPGYITKEQLQGEIDGIGVLIPEEASEDNQLADKEYVNNKVSTDSATYRGSYNLVTDLQLTVSATREQIGAALVTVISVADNNDFCYVEIPAETASPNELTSVDKYKYNGTTWLFEYSMDKSIFSIKTSDITALTSQQLDALRNGDIVVKITGNHKHTYTVAYKDNVAGELSLVYCDHENIEEVYYEKQNGTWTYIQTDNYNFNAAIGAVINTMDMSEANGDITIQYETV